MGLFNITKKLSLTLVGLSYLCVTHAADYTKAPTTGVITIDGNDCGKTFSKNGKIFVLMKNIECNDDDGNFALEFSGNHNLIVLNEHSITAVNPEPGIGILITGNENRVIGLGTVEGFGSNIKTDGNIVIENAVGNHVSKLTLKKGINGILIKALDGGNAQANHIYHNHVQDVDLEGIYVLSVDNSSADANHIHDNHIQGVGGLGIAVGILGVSSSADANHIHDNRIQDAFFGGISLFYYGDGSVNDNEVISNHIIHPLISAIRVGNFTADNLIDNNLTKEVVIGPAYCDQAGMGANDWGTNFIDMVPEMGFPDLCF